ncbi:hypothetical protein [Sinomonas mesophila]|uniref:hypothetical protein n=1 Tax=Sinomonas mesophila TaxID=1531955 RepID=UPI000986C746|nr:hypothetical protein [Sinomonas mesophila]
MHVEVLNLAMEVLAEIPKPSPEAPPGSGGFVKILGYVAWVVFGLAVLGVLTVAGKMMNDHNNGRGGSEHAQRLGQVLAGAIIASVASGIVGAIVTASGGMA